MLKIMDNKLEELQKEYNLNPNYIENLKESDLNVMKSFCPCYFNL